MDLNSYVVFVCCKKTKDFLQLPGSETHKGSDGKLLSFEVYTTREASHIYKRTTITPKYRKTIEDILINTKTVLVRVTGAETNPDEYFIQLSPFLGLSEQLANLAGLCTAAQDSSEHLLPWSSKRCRNSTKDLHIARCLQQIGFTMLYCFYSICSGDPATANHRTLVL